MLELAWAKQQYSRYNMAGRIYPAQFSRISSHLRNQGHLNRNYNVEASSKQDIRKDARKRRRSEEHTSELQSLMRISYAVFCLKKKKKKTKDQQLNRNTTRHTHTQYHQIHNNT